jgi:hypothetical protein
MSKTAVKTTAERALSGFRFFMTSYLKTEHGDSHFVFLLAVSLIQNISFRANCVWRDEPDSPVGNRVLVIRPKSGVPTTLSGGPRFA